MSAALNSIKRDLYALCSKFILDNQITCPEAIYQMDHVMGAAPEFIDELCSLIGFAEVTDAGEESDDFED